MPDAPTTVTPVTVTYVPTPVHMYPAGHTSHDPHVQRFMSYSSIPTSPTPIPVTADNPVQTSIGWEGVGLAPLLSINPRTTRPQANKAAMKAMIVNRVGDSGPRSAIPATLLVSGALDYPTVFRCAPHAAASRFVLPV